jgi:Fe-Mn family superoxide dismutase
MSEAMSRRNVLVKGAAAVAAVGIAGTAGKAFGDVQPIMSTLPYFIGDGFANGEYVLPPLPYAYDALEPHIDKDTMTLHHDKHHKAYVDGLNKTLKELDTLRSAPGEINVSALSGLEEDLTFNGSGHILHSIFWKTMAPNAGAGVQQQLPAVSGGGEPGPALTAALNKNFGSVEAFRAQFSKVAAGVKGSGWAILAYEPLGDKLIVQQVKQHDMQTVFGVVPILPLDVWEHAYYLKYHNVRADYVKAWWNVVNWNAVESLYTAANISSPQTPKKG